MIRSVRLFPRLATTKPASQTSSRGKLTAIRAAAAPDADAAATARAEVKARLLQMILDNEHVRRNGQRPNQV
jgi:hypothetical protein